MESFINSLLKEKVLNPNIDDLRQDAVLSSVFNTINTLLQKNRNSRQRNLHIRTYKIVPVAPQAGVVHWVDGTNPLGDILMEAHSK
jgi:ataxia telangiectasia mutated family protein